jgi:5'-nucleotidase
MGYKILVTNDDGIGSEGIKALIKILKPLGELFVVAPSKEKSAAAHSITFNGPLKVKFLNKKTVEVEGTPTDCVMFGVYGLLNYKRPDLLVSGINNGANLGDDITYSGTVSAALEGSLLGIPSIAFSLVGKTNHKYYSASKFIKNLCKFVIKNKLPKNTFLNVNIPNLNKDEIKGVAVVKQGKRIYKDSFIREIDTNGNTYYWLRGEEPSYVKEPDTDFYAIENNMIAVTPLHFDLTNYSQLKCLKTIEKIKI